jgi:hypothetical protein
MSHGELLIFINNGIITGLIFAPLTLILSPRRGERGE